MAKDYDFDKKMKGSKPDNFDYDKEALKKYIEKLLSFENQKNFITESDLSEVAKELGLSDNDIKNIKLQADNHIKKGKGYLAHQCYDQAIDEYNQAYALSPLNIDVLKGLARSYLNRFNEKKQNEDKTLALKYANRGIDLFPDVGDFYDVIKALNKKIDDYNYKNTNAKSKKLQKLAVLIITVMFIMSGIFIIYFNPKRGNNDAGQKTTDSYNTSISIKLAEPNEFDIPVVLKTDDKISNIKFVKDISLYNKYDDSYSYTLKCEFFCPDVEVQKLTVKVSILDSAGNIVNSKFKDVISDSDESVYPGDSIPVGILIHEKVKPPVIKKAEVSIYFIKAIPTSGNYELKNELPVKWETGKNENLNITVYQRDSSVRGGFGTKYHFLTMRIKNTGMHPVKHLKIGAVWFDKSGKAIVSNYVYGVSNSLPQINTGVVRTCRIIGTFTKDMPDFSKFELSVVEIN
jgi:tetratricopeptide (TPR) repeat protein